VGVGEERPQLVKSLISFCIQSVVLSHGTYSWENESKKANNIILKTTDHAVKDTLKTTGEKTLFLDKVYVSKSSILEHETGQSEKNEQC
jgi:hypothetical protein